MVYAVWSPPPSSGIPCTVLVTPVNDKPFFWENKPCNSDHGAYDTLGDTWGTYMVFIVKTAIFAVWIADGFHTIPYISGTFLMISTMISCFIHILLLWDPIISTLRLSNVAQKSICRKSGQPACVSTRTVTYLLASSTVAGWKLRELNGGFFRCENHWTKWLASKPPLLDCLNGDIMQHEYNLISMLAAWVIYVWNNHKSP